LRFDIHRTDRLVFFHPGHPFIKVILVQTEKADAKGMTVMGLEEEGRQ